MNEAIGTKSMESADAIRANQRQWFKETKARVEKGEPFAICHADTVEEILITLDIPFQVVNPWNALIATKRMTQYYNGVLEKKGYDTNPTGILLISGGLACTMDNNPETAPWGGLPKPTVVVGSRGDLDMRILELWARELGCRYYPLQKQDFTERPHHPLWWDGYLKDHWDEIIDPAMLDFRVEQEKALIHYLEATTERTFSMVKLNRAMTLMNELYDYWRKARDLICETVPCPVSIRDQLTIYQVQWHRGTEKARDLMKAFYEEVKERVRKGITPYPNEKIRLMWEDGTPPAWADYIQEKYGAVCVSPYYSSIAVDGYPRTVLNNDPLRTVASRHLMMIMADADWRLKDAKLCKCDGVIQMAGFRVGGGFAAQMKAFKEAGIPFLGIPRDSDDSGTRSVLDSFIEKLLLSKQ